MKALTIYQPWASLIAVGAKRYVTSSRYTRYRGLVAIHAGKREWYLAYWQGQRETQDALISALRGNYNLPRGAVIATGELAECYLIGHDAGGTYIAKRSGTTGEFVKHAYITGDELLFGDFTPGRYAWEWANVQRLPEPVPCKGRQGL